MNKIQLLDALENDIVSFSLKKDFSSISNNRKIDITKKAITIANIKNLETAKRISRNLSQFDIYIYKTTKNIYVVYAVNIKKENIATTLKIIQNDFKDAYKSSKYRINKLATNNFAKNIFVKSVEKLEKVSALSQNMH